MVLVCGVVCSSRACLSSYPLGAGVQGAGLPVSCGVCSVPLSLPFVRFPALPLVGYA